MYVLMNTYIYNWESDYFGVSKSGYTYEIEIKVSRSDFFADFKKKKKHRMLQLAREGRSFLTTRGYTRYSYDYKDWQGNVKRRETVSMDVPDENHKNVKLLSTDVRFPKIVVPNRFYYAVPEGLIDKKEVPDYAGLIYVDDFSIKKIKEAPFLTKRKPDLNSILLDKFYYLSLDQRIRIKQLEIENIKLRRIEGELVETIKEPQLEF
jgi:hypothetical protein